MCWSRVKKFIYFSTINILDSYFSKEEKNIVLVFQRTHKIWICKRKNKIHNNYWKYYNIAVAMLLLYYRYIRRTVQLFKVQSFGTHWLFVYKRIAAGKVGDGSRVQLITNIDWRTVVQGVVRTSTSSVHFLCAFSTVLRCGRWKKHYTKPLLSSAIKYIWCENNDISYKIL